MRKKAETHPGAFPKRRFMVNDDDRVPPGRDEAKDP